MEESESWATLVMVVRSLEWRFSIDMVARDFRSWAGLKGGVAGFSLEKGIAPLHFEEARERDLVLHQPWIVMGHALAVKP